MIKLAALNALFRALRTGHPDLRIDLLELLVGAPTPRAIGKVAGWGFGAGTGSAKLDDHDRIAAAC
ncbi:MAG: hypothetical protein JO266_02765 [Acidobacteria bacterium]|nr:hypothetical protein [Acidobacteriota bacterium]